MVDSSSSGGDAQQDLAGGNAGLDRSADCQVESRQLLGIEQGA
jgi:hypothetical protein